MNLASSFLKHFDPLEDPRLDNHNRRHELTDILVITILASICGADTWTEIYNFACAKYDWLKGFLALPNGVPSHDTFGRVFSLIEPEGFETCFRSWISSLDIDMNAQIIAVDGKTLRGSGNRRKSKRPLHLVSAWASSNHVLLAQVQTADKSNEIEAIPRLLQMLDLKQSIVTIDAMGCQKSIAQQILDQGGNYILSLKENQGTLFESVKNLFDLGEILKFKKILNKRMVEKVRDHGRSETRRYTLVSAKDPKALQIRWPGLKSFGMLEVKRTVNHQTTRSRRFFLTSLDEDILAFKRAARQHWSIEINLHWSLDVSFREDHNRCRIGHAPRNLATVRRIALNLLKDEKTLKRGILCKRKTAGWDHKYLMKILNVTENSMN